MLNDYELLDVKGGSYFDSRFPVLSLAVRYCHVLYLVNKLFVD